MTEQKPEMPLDALSEKIKQGIAKIKSMNQDDWAREFRELAYHAKTQFFAQIPGVSAIAGILVGSWVASTFTSSPIKGFLSSVGLMKGGSHVVSSGTYRFLSVVLPLVAVVLTAYIVQKVMKGYRERRLARDKEFVAQLDEKIQAVVEEKMGILEKARTAGLLSENEYHTKVAGLYQDYSRTGRTTLENLLLK